MPRLVLQIVGGAMLAYASLSSIALGQSELGKSQQELRDATVINGHAGIVEIGVEPNVGALGALCTGTMIGPDAVVTAAHCMYGLASEGVTSSQNNFTIFYYDPDRGRRMVFTGRAAWFEHQGFDKGPLIRDQAGNLTNERGDTPQFDVALIRTNTNFTGTDYTDYVRIFSDRGAILTEGYNHLTFYGTGLFNFDGDADNRLRTADLRVEGVDADQIVLDNTQNIRVCLGDSGGPAQYRIQKPGAVIDTVAGVLSFAYFRLNRPPTCAINMPLFDNAFFARLRWAGSFQDLAERADLDCPAFDSTGIRYRRCFDIPFVNDAPYEGYSRGVSSGLIAAAF